MTTLARQTVETAKQYNHQAWTAPHSEGPYCALFVRHCFKKNRIDLPDSKKPSDLMLMRPSDGGLAPSFANSLAGDEIGSKVARKQDLKEGDIVFFSHTDPKYTPGIITHVGIYAGGGMIVDRGSGAVHHRSIDTFHRFFEGRRPKAFMSESAAAGSGSGTFIELRNGTVIASANGKHVSSLKLSIFTGGYVEVNNHAQKASSYQAEFQTAAGWIKAYGHHGKHQMHGANTIVVEARNGALHLKAGDLHHALSEIKTMKGRIEVMTGSVPQSALSGMLKSQVGIGGTGGASGTGSLPRSAHSSMLKSLGGSGTGGASGSGR